MSKLAHSHQPTMDAIDLDRAIENGDEDLIADHFADMHKETGIEKLLGALQEKRGTMLRYPEVRALCRILAASR